MQDNDDQDNADTEPPSPPKRYFGIEETVFILLVILSLLGIFVTDFSPEDGYGFWLLMVPVFGILSIFVSWLQAKTSENDIGDIVKIQGMHWLHTLIIVVAASLLNKSGQLNDMSASLVILLILALTTMLDGIRIGWQFSLLGFFLAACAIIVAFVEQFIWTCVGLALIVVACTLLRGFWINRHPANE